MDIIDSLMLRLRGASQYAQIALLSECGERIYPLYEEYWVGDYFESVRRSIDIGWTYACGGLVDESELESRLAEVEEIADFYYEEGIDVLAETITVVLRVLQSISTDEDESCLAVARGLTTIIDVAQSAEAMANEGSPESAIKEIAVAEEEDWQEGALKLIGGWQGIANRTMFDSLGGKPPNWLLDWRLRSVR